MGQSALNRVREHLFSKDMLSLVTPLHITVKGNQVNIPELKSGLNNCNNIIYIKLNLYILYLLLLL